MKHPGLVGLAGLPSKLCFQEFFQNSIRFQLLNMQRLSHPLRLATTNINLCRSSQTNTPEPTKELLIQTPLHVFLFLCKIKILQSDLLMHYIQVSPFTQALNILLPA